MRVIWVLGVVGVLASAVAGCANPNTKPTHIGFGSSSDAITMGPALRMVTERPRQIDAGPPLPTQCSEPSPDVAIAFSRGFEGEGKVTEPEGPTVEGKAKITLNETATQLNGRTAGVLALRDGLYAACQSYVNGVLGHDAYAIILSQYGNLLVALAGTQTSGSPSAYTAQESAIAAMLVACVSEHDPTRIRPTTPTGYVDTNPLLSVPRCKALLDKISTGRLVVPPKKASNPAPAKKVAKLEAGEKLITSTKTVMEKAGPPVAAASAK